MNEILTRDWLRVGSPEPVCPHCLQALPNPTSATPKKLGRPRKDDIAEFRDMRLFIEVERAGSWRKALKEWGVNAAGTLRRGPFKGEDKERLRDRYYHTVACTKAQFGIGEEPVEVTLGEFLGSGGKEFIGAYREYLSSLATFLGKARPHYDSDPSVRAEVERRVRQMEDMEAVYKRFVAGIAEELEELKAAAGLRK